jgi:hypothetical protein
MIGSRPSTLAWILVHLLFPLLPVIFEGIIRLVLTGMKFHTFSAATLAISSGLLSLFVNQSLRGSDPSIPDPTELDSRNGACALFIMLAIFFFVMFGVVISMHALVHDRQISQLTSPLHIFQTIVFIAWIAPVVGAVVAQRSFKLRASLI